MKKKVRGTKKLKLSRETLMDLSKVTGGTGSDNPHTYTCTVVAAPTAKCGAVK